MVTCGSLSESVSSEDFVGFRGGIFYADIHTTGECGDNLTLIGADSKLCITAESPWSGDTETGFGRDVTVSLNVEQAIKLRTAIDTWLASKQSGENQS